MAESGNFEGSNVVLLSEVRMRLRSLRAGAPAAPPAVRSGREIVTLVTGGRFEAMVNGETMPLVARMFVRAPAETLARFRDIGAMQGTLLAVSFPAGLETAFYHDLAAALPCHATAFPAEGAMGFRRLLVIARRWGISVADHRAA